MLIAAQRRQLQLFLRRNHWGRRSQCQPDKFCHQLRLHLKDRECNDCLRKPSNTSSKMKTAKKLTHLKTHIRSTCRCDRWAVWLVVVIITNETVELWVVRQKQALVAPFVWALAERCERFPDLLCDGFPSFPDRLQSTQIFYCKGDGKQDSENG